MTPLHVAVTTTAPFGTVEDECASAAVDAARTLASLGHHVVEATPEWNVILASMIGPMSVPGMAALVGLDDIELLEPRNRPMLESMTALTVVDHARWVDGLRAAAAEFVRFWDDIDVLVTPTAGMVPMSVDWAPWDLDREAHSARFATFANFAQPFNLSGQPALSLPLAWSSEGLPIGVQLAGRRFDEALLLRLARQLEAALPWSDRHPAMADAVG
jgi:Asp-tRNA(Asn)/Glu-tRNA(Gln) amidotransferase A subunit family amidase